MATKYADMMRGGPLARPEDQPPSGPGVQPDDQSWTGGFLASTLSSIPELFGADPSQAAVAFRSGHPWAGTASEIAGFAVPYIGAEAAVAKIPGLAARVGRGAEALAGGVERLGFKGAAESPIVRGASRELLVNAPVEASRMIVGGTAYPDKQNELGWDVLTNAGVTAALGGIGGALARGGTKAAGKAYIEGTDAFTANTHKLKALEDGAKVQGADPEELATQLERDALQDNPGYKGRPGSRKKKLSYMMQLEGQTAEESKGLNSMLEPGKEEVKVEGLDPGEPKPVKVTKQYFVENESAVKQKAKFLAPGQLETVLAQMPEPLNTTRKLAANVQFPRYYTVVDEQGARELAGKLSLNGMSQVGKTKYIQEKNGAFFVAHKLEEGTGKAVGKGAGKVQVGDRYLMGKMLDPSLLEPEAKGLSDLVTANWAKLKTPFHEGLGENIFSKADDEYSAVINKQDYRKLSQMAKRNDRVGFIADKLGKIKAEGKGLVDSKFNLSDSKSVQELAKSIELSIKPTSFLQMKYKDYGFLHGLQKNGQQLADELTRRIMFGSEKLKEGASPARAIFGTGRAALETISGYKGHRPVEQILKNVTDDEANTIAHLSNANVLSEARVKKLVKDGTLSPEAGSAVEELRALNRDVVGDITPVLAEGGHAKVEWLENHLGIPRVSRGELFTEVKDKNGVLKHIAWGKTGAEVEKEAKTVVAEANARGEKWSFDPAQKRSLPTESEQALNDLQRTMSNSIGKNRKDEDILAAAMQRLAEIKGRTGKNPTTPITSGAFKKRKSSPSALSPEAVQQFSKADLLDAMHGHVGQMFKFGAIQNFENKFGHVAIDELKSSDPKLYDDLMLKSRQYLGIDSPFTNAINKKLSNILPSSMGPKPATAIAAAVNETVFSFTLGLANLSHAILNVLSPIQTVMPWIMHMATLPPEAAADLMGHTITVNAKGGARGLSAWVEPIKVMGSAMKLMAAPTPELKEFLERALRDGIFHPQLFEEWVGQGAKSRFTLAEAWKNGGMATFLRKAATFAGEESEKMSRLIAFNAAYRVGKDIAGLEGDALYRFMKRSNEVTMFNYHTVDRSNLFTGPVGSMFGLFKNWQMHFMGNLMQYAGLAINEGNFGPLVWAGGSAVALGGLGATPLIAIADGLGDWGNQQNSSFLWMQKNFSPTMADATYFGLPAFAGVSLQASSALPGTDVRNEVTSLFSFAMWNRAKMLYTVYNKADELKAAGVNPMSDPNIRDMLMQAVAPRAMIRAMSVTEGDYVRSMTSGYPQERAISPIARMLHGAGVNMVEIEKWQKTSKILYDHQEKMNQAIRGLGRAYYLATSAGDSDEADRVILAATGMAIPLDKVARSAMAIKKREETGDVLSRYSLADQAMARDMLQNMPDTAEPTDGEEAPQ